VAGRSPDPPGTSREATKLKFVVILNPIAGHGKSLKAWSAIKPVLDARVGEYAVWRTEYVRHGEALGRRAAEDGYDMVAVLSGDGTLSEVANGFLQVPFDQRPILGPLPGGTGNDYSRTLGTPRDPAAAAVALFDGHTRLLDAGRVNDRYFLNVAGVGFDAEVSRMANALVRKYGGGAPMYMACILWQLGVFKLAPVELELDGEKTSRRVLLVAAGVAKYCGGGLKLCPGAEPDDGLLDIVVGEDLTKPETLSILPRLYPGTHILHPKVKSYRAKRITITSDRPLYIQSDGEITGQAPVTFETVPAALRVAGCGEPKPSGTK
jgi:diacylglycerol kinase (ATP)